MALTKNVNGIVVPLSVEEEAAVRAEWAMNDPAIVRPPAPPRDLAAEIDSIRAVLEAKSIATRADFAAALDATVATDAAVKA